jgi:putative membrane protein
MLPHVIGSSLHYIAVFLLVGAVTAELYLLKLKPSAEVIAVAARADLMYGVGAVLVLMTGLAGVFHNGKGVAYYMHNGAFHGAVTFFILAGLLSIAPTMRYLRWRRAAVLGGALPTDAEWKAQRKWVHMQLGLFALIAVCMSMMARGVGSFS